MKKLLVLFCCVASMGTLMAVGMHTSFSVNSIEFQPKPGAQSSPHVMQSADCTPTPPPDPGGHPKKLKVPATLPLK